VNTLDVAVDEYLHLIARVCPWDLRREQSRLQAFCDWLDERSELSLDLDAIEPGTALRHADEAGLGAAECQELLAALSGLYRWAKRDGRVTDNPFAPAYEWAKASRRCASGASR
jgi:site-specific recombinase XerD